MLMSAVKFEPDTLKLCSVDGPPPATYVKPLSAAGAGTPMDGTAVAVDVVPEINTDPMVIGLLAVVLLLFFQ